MIDFIATLFNVEDITAYKEAGAGSVVVAVPFFSVCGVHSFSNEELIAIRTITKRENMRMLVSVNRFFTEEELPNLRLFLSFLKDLDVDGLYYGDECVLYEADAYDMKEKLIYAPDTLAVNHEDVQYYLDEGIAMVSISREITLEEIKSIAVHVKGEIEMQIHGRCAMMHSKRNLLTNYMQFIGNETMIRNKQSLYIIEEKREDLMPILEDETGTHVFSGYTLASFKELIQMSDAGIRHFRIDGMFHDAAYVIEALNLYTSIVKGADAAAILEAYKLAYQQDHVREGFYYTKTSKVKEGGSSEKN